MGSYIEINDTLQISKEQGFPAELDIHRHLQTPYSLKDVEGKIFEFQDKAAIRIYKIPPVRNFLVENINGKWVYWGLVHIQETKCDYVKQTTSGKFKIIYLNTPEEMMQAFKLIDHRSEYDFFE